MCKLLKGRWHIPVFQHSWLSLCRSGKSDVAGKMDGILISLGCPNYHKLNLVAYHNRNFFSLLEAQSLKSTY